MNTKLSLLSLMAYALIALPAAAHADCPDLSGEYTCQGGKTVITQTAIPTGGVHYVVHNFGAPPDDQTSFDQDYIADGKPEAGQALSEEDGGSAPTTSCGGANEMESSIWYAYWGLNPVHRSTEFNKQSNGDIEVVEWDYSAINGNMPGFPHRTSYTCTKTK